MTYISDRGRIELAMPLLAMRDIVRQVQGSSVDKTRCQNHIGVALIEALETGDKKRNAKLLRRARSAFADMVTPYEEIGADMRLYGLAVYTVLKLMVDQHYLSIGEDSYGKALELFLPAVTPPEETWDEDHALASAGAYEILTLARGRGLYHDLDLTPLQRTTP